MKKEEEEEEEEEEQQQQQQQHFQEFHVFPLTSGRKKDEMAWQPTKKWTLFKPI